MPHVKSTRYYENFSLQEQKNAEQPTESEQRPEPMDAESYTAEMKEEIESEASATAQKTENEADTADTVCETSAPPSAPDENVESQMTEQDIVNSEQIFDDSSNDFAPEDSSGELVVQAFTARETSPIMDAAVTIYQNKNGASKVVSFYLTDENGKTPNITLPAPSKEGSQSPSDTLPFADYNIVVRHPMYYTAVIDNVQVFGDELTIQTVNLVPLPEFINRQDTTRTIITPKQNL